MPITTLGPKGLLSYNPTYKILICRECHYAIQKSAVPSHLLRHKIYRDKRHQLLSTISELDLLEPHLVLLPTADSPPIDALPVISGYKCTAEGCGNLCATLKRMRRHWTEVHGLSEAPSSFAVPVQMQTFFRGTKLRYFEVAVSSLDGSTAGPATAESNDNGNDHNQEHGLEEDKEVEEEEEAQPPYSPGSSFQPFSINIDLQTMTYFHHFITATSLTLPCAEDRQSAAYWQEDIVRLALQHQWLMCGLLAISACHMAILADEDVTKQSHRKRAEEFSLGFPKRLEEVVESRSSTDKVEFEEEARNAADQIQRILHCAFAKPNQLHQHYIMDAIRNILTPYIVPSAENDHNYRQEQAFAEASRVLNSTLHSPNDTASALLTRLTTLPSHMAEIFGRPDDPQDVMTILSAIAALVDCCATCFASNDNGLGAAWRCMLRWVTKVPGRFDEMASRRDTATLVVLAHWAALLVRRVEDCGCWFLRGWSRDILLWVSEGLPVDIRVQGLVAGLMV
ncbi:hypothetical protein BJX76DRAFT_368896 [Aspergillus varians]